MMAKLLPQFEYDTLFEQNPEEMVYDWDSKEAECRRLLVDEGKTQDEVLDILKAEGFAPR